MIRQERFPSFTDPWPVGSMVTASGIHFNLLDPDPQKINIDDIAHGLASNCRWNGHSANFFSVAQHCCMMFDHAPEENRLAYLLHDAEEAYWGDIIKPIKDMLRQSNPELVVHMINLRNIILAKYNAGQLDMDIKIMDTYWQEWEYKYVVIGTHPYSWDPIRAKYEFLHRFSKHFEEYGQPKPI